MPQHADRRRGSTSPDRDGERDPRSVDLGRAGFVEPHLFRASSALALQRAAGNSAVAGLVGRHRLPREVQRSAVSWAGKVVPGSQEEETYLFRQHATWLWAEHGPPALTSLFEQLQEMHGQTEWDRTQLGWLRHTIEQVYGTVVSGHGAINKQLILENTPALAGTRRSGGGTTFTLPEGVHLVFYAPDGVLLEQQVANAVELGSPPSVRDVILQVNGGSVKKPVPEPYPIVAGPGAAVENYTVSPPLRLTVRGAAQTVQGNTLLSTLVAQMAEAGGGIVHFACCMRMGSDKSPLAGYYLRFRKPNERAG